MKRRDAILALLALGAVPGASGQSTAKVPRIALVDPEEPAANIAEGRNPLWSAFLAELRRLGYAEGQTIALDRWSGGGGATSEVHAALSRKVVASQPRLIVVRGRSLLVQLAAATNQVPIVAVATIPPELRASLARPGKNVTGIHQAFDAQQLYGKQVEILRDVLKPGAQIAWLGARFAWESLVGEGARKGAATANVVLLPVLVATPVNRVAIRRAFDDIAQSRVDGILIWPGLFTHRVSIAELAAAHKLPSLGSDRHWAEAGTLLSYGASLEEMGRRAAHYVERVLKGADPAAMPIEQPTKVELVINLETAKSLGTAIPQSMLLRADRVIE